MKETGRKLACEIAAGFKAFFTRSLRAPAASRKWGGATIILKVSLKLNSKSLRAWFNTTLLNMTLRGCVTKNQKTFNLDKNCVFLRKSLYFIGRLNQEENFPVRNSACA